MAKKSIDVPENEMMTIINRKVKERDDYHRAIRYEQERMQRDNRELHKELGCVSFQLRDEMRNLIGMEGRKRLQVIGTSWEQLEEYPIERSFFHCYVFIEWDGFETSRVSLSCNSDMDITVDIPTGPANTHLIKRGNDFVYAIDLSRRISFATMAEIATRAILESARVKKGTI